MYRSRMALAKGIPLPGSLKITAVAPVESRHKNDVVAVIYFDEKVISGADDGKIKVWTPDLQPICEIQAHLVNVYSLATIGDTIYSCSNDGSLKAWQLINNNLVLKCILMEENNSREVVKVQVNPDWNRVYGITDSGEVHIFENNHFVTKYFFEEPVCDCIILGKLLFNARNTDISVTEMMPQTPKCKILSRGCLIGRFPIRLIGDKVCFLARDAKTIYVHDCTMEARFRRYKEIKAHDMTVTAMTSVYMEEKPNLMVSGGYDRWIRLWDLNTYKKLAQLEVPVCVNELSCGAPGYLYVASTEGFLAKLEITLK